MKIWKFGTMHTNSGTKAVIVSPTGRTEVLQFLNTIYTAGLQKAEDWINSQKALLEGTMDTFGLTKGKDYDFEDMDGAATRYHATQALSKVSKPIGKPKK
jgi:hypothetical protein